MSKEKKIYLVGMAVFYGLATSPIFCNTSPWFMLALLPMGFCMAMGMTSK